MKELIPVNNDKKFSYNICVCDSYSYLHDLIDEIGIIHCNVLFICDKNTEKLFDDEVKNAFCDCNISFYTIDNLSNFDKQKESEKVISFLSDNNFSNGDILVCFGGSKVYDVCLFALKLVDFRLKYISIPTTLNSMIVNSINEKNKSFDNSDLLINCKSNLVYINVKILNTLSGRHYFSAMSEVMKYGLIKDARFYEWIIENLYEISDKESQTLINMIRKCLEIKKFIVESETSGKDMCSKLLLGETIARILENDENNNLIHGEAVALGIFAAAYISKRHGLLSTEECYEIRDMFVPFNLPISLDCIDKEKILEEIKNQSFSDENGYKFILLKKVGKAVVDYTVNDEDILDALKEINLADEVRND